LHLIDRPLVQVPQLVLGLRHGSYDLIQLRLEGGAVSVLARL
jgi:hypothetical protein